MCLDRHGDEALRNHLFRQPYLEYGSDLFATDIQRGRDHGLPPYTDYIKHCHNKTVNKFEDLKEFLVDNVTELLRKVYGNVNDIDLYTGGLSEKPIENAEMGKTFACLISDVFHRLKFGDRFYYEHGNQSGSFTEANRENRCVQFCQVSFLTKRILTWVPRKVPF
ncbi:hypothetical protein V5799_017536 [Amblyomma americanum]|uniref:Uncharacterized protein n=1 Tax=Amblyomma americanum TaxID=6943 RepID=A0AAQ4F1U4_AMBAM